MSAPASNGPEKDPKDDKSIDYTIAKAAGAVIATGIAWSVFKTFWPKKAEQGYETVSDDIHAFESNVEEKSEGFADKASSIAKKFPKFPRKSKSSPQGYEVTFGDTLYGISRKYGVSVEAIKEANALPDDIIVVGEKLNIPK